MTQSHETIYPNKPSFNTPFPKPDVVGLTREGYFLANPEELRSRVLSFLKPRPSLAYSDTNFPLMVSFMVAELHEAEAEENRSDSVFSNVDLQKELIDVIFFIESLADGNHITFNNARIAHLLNGLAKQPATRSSSYDRMREIAGNLQHDVRNGNLLVTSELELLLAFLYARLYQLRDPVDPALSMAKVMAKNERNYPQEYFGKWDYESRRELRGDELVAKYRHASRCLRTIRTASGNNLDGLHPEFHRPFAYLISDWKHSDRAFQELCSELKQEFWKLIFQGSTTNTETGIVRVQRQVISDSKWQRRGEVMIGSNRRGRNITIFRASGTT